MGKCIFCSHEAKLTGEHIWSVKSRRPWLVAALLGFVFLVFVPTLRYSLVYDDTEQIVRNPRLAAWSYVPEYFTTGLWSHLSSKDQSLYYRPAFLIWLRLAYAMMGPPSNIWHLASILAHLGATLSVFMLIRRLTGEFQGAILGAGLFAIHPVQAEAVALVSSVSEPLLTVFVVLSVYFYAGRKGPVSIVSCLFAALAMLTKETGMVAPALIFAYEWTRSSFKGAVTGAAPYLLPALLCIALRVNAVGQLGNGMPPSMSMGDMILTWPRVLAVYCLHLLWPVHLSASYEFP
jgi:hypothetical protein